MTSLPPSLPPPPTITYKRPRAAIKLAQPGSRHTPLLGPSWSLIRTRLPLHLLLPAAPWGPIGSAGPSECCPRLAWGGPDFEERILDSLPQLHLSGSPSWTEAAVRGLVIRT